MSFEIGPPPFITIRNRPPVASFSFLKITLSKNHAPALAPGNPFPSKKFLADMAPQKRLFTKKLFLFSWPNTPFFTDSQTAGTPTRMVGLNSRISPWQLRIDASDSVRGLPYPIVPPQNRHRFSNMNSRMWACGRYVNKASEGPMYSPTTSLAPAAIHSQ